MRFDDVKRSFRDPDTDAESFPPLTDADPERAETVLGVRLPAGYLELLRVRNGGYVAKHFNAFATTEPTTWADDHVWLRTLSAGCR